MTKSEKLKIIEAAIKEHGRLSDLAVNQWINTVKSCMELRKLALVKRLDWDQVKDKYSAGECLLCVFTRRLTQGCSVCCKKCLWLRYERVSCFDFTGHTRAMSRYEQWLELLELERKLNDNVATHRDGTPE